MVLTVGPEENGTHSSLYFSGNPASVAQQIPQPRNRTHACDLLETNNAAKDGRWYQPNAPKKLGTSSAVAGCMGTKVGSVMTDEKHI